jgi:hypothetical protein
MLRAVLIGISEGKGFADGNLIFRLKKYCGEELPSLVFSLFVESFLNSFWHT